MSAYIALAHEPLQAFLADYALGAPLDWLAIHDGIENSNYVLRTEQGEYVLTLFESLAAAALPPYLAVMAGLAARGLPCPQAVPDRAGRLLGELHGKPALLAAKLAGASPLSPSPQQCYAVGAALAAIHLAGRQLPPLAPNPCGSAWRHALAQQLHTHLDRDSARLLADELAFQDGQDHSALPRGLIHGDLFRDNVLFAGAELTGLLDWYEASTDAWLYDVAVAANDWCVGSDGALQPARYAALLQGYASLRPLCETEQQALPAMLRAAALRFWLSRLLAGVMSRDGHMVQRKDPDEFKRILLQRRASA